MPVNLLSHRNKIDRIKKALRRYKTGVPTTVKLSDTNMHDTVFSGTRISSCQCTDIIGSDLVNWVLNYFHFNNRADGLEFCKFLQQKKVFKGFNGSRQVFKDSSSSFYCFYDDDYDQYLRNLPPEQVGLFDPHSKNTARLCLWVDDRSFGNSNEPRFWKASPSITADWMGHEKIC